MIADIVQVSSTALNCVLFFFVHSKSKELMMETVDKNKIDVQDWSVPNGIYSNDDNGGKARLKCVHKMHNGFTQTTHTKAYGYYASYSLCFAYAFAVPLI